MAQCTQVGQTPDRLNFGRQCRKAAVAGSELCSAHGGVEDSKTPEAIRKRIDRGKPKCHVIKKNGEQCKRYVAVPGARVCRSHGGNLPNVQKAASERIKEMLDPALNALNDIVRDTNASDADRLRAVQMILNRTGFGEKTELTVEMKPWEELMGASEGFAGIMRELPAERLTELAARTTGVVEAEIVEEEPRTDNERRPAAPEGDYARPVDIASARKSSPLRQASNPPPHLR